MADEEVTTPEAEAVVETPSAEEVTETTEEVVEPEVPAEPEDNSERSKLGRKVKTLELALEDALDKMNRMATKPADTGLDFGEDAKFADDDEEISFRKGDMRKMIMDTLKVTLPKVAVPLIDSRLNVKDEYNKKAAIAVGRLGADTDEAEFEQIAQYIEKRFKRHTGVPEIDAKMNFLEAQLEITKASSKKKVNPLDKNKGKKADNLGGGGGETAPTKKNVTLSPEMKKLQAKYNLSNEALQRVAKQQGVK